MLLTTNDRAVSFLRSVREAVRCAFLCALFSLFAGALSAQERVTLEAERHEDHGRMIITFPDRMHLPDYDVSSDNNVLVVTFDAEVRGFLPDLPETLPDQISIARFDPDMRGVRAGLRGPTRINTMEAGEQLFIDFLPTDWVGRPPALPAETVERLARRAEEAARIAEERRRAEMVEEYNPIATVRVGHHPTFTRVVFDWNVGTQAELVRDEETPRQARIVFDWPVPIDLYELLSGLPEEILGVENQQTAGSSIVELSLAEETDLRFYQEAQNRFVLDIDSIGADGDMAELIALVEAAGLEYAAPGPVTALDRAEPIAPPGSDQSEIVPYVMHAGATVRIVFPFDQEIASAVFRRGDTVWMVFDTDIVVNAPDANSQDSLEGIVGAFSVQHGGGAQIVRMTLDENRLATIGSEGRAWVLSLGDVLLSAAEPIVLDRRQSAAGLHEVTADLGRPSRVHQLRDPDVGDILDVVTAYPPARAMMRDLEYVDFVTPRSIHGLVVRPRHDEVSVGIEDDLAIISAQTGLTISPALQLRARTPVESRESAMDLASYREANPIDFRTRRNEIAGRTAGAEGRELDRARLELSRFYLANEYAHEALGILSNLRADLRQTGLEPSIAITEAAANVMAGRAEEALDALDSEILRDEADAMIWRTMARVKTGDFDGARLDALGAQEVIDEYPNWVRSRFLLAGTRAAIANEDAANAGRFMERIDLVQLGRDQISEYELLSGMLDELNGNHTNALESYGRVIVADRRPTTAEAVLRTISLLDEIDQLDVARAVETVAVQATLWRGDAIELELMRLLTDLQFRNGQYREAFVNTRQAASAYDDADTLGQMIERARNEFVSLYLDGAADALDPVEALSIYYDFRHLTPPGAQGDLMIRNLAQRLIKVDLLTHASELLDYQVANRLQGASRAQVAADLAIVHIANRQPNDALAVLDQTRLANLPPALERQRRVLEARALIDANRQELALDLLTNVEGRDTQLLRIEALWRANRHREAGELIEMLYAPDLERGALSPVARMNIVKAAVGYVIADDGLGLSRLRSRYAQVMASTPEWDMFTFVTGSVETTSRQFREIAAEIAAIDSLNAFLNAYREIYTAETALAPSRAARAAGV